jgi:alkylation response protein AidB-like acyl-CoA dehydrogenase
MDAATVLDNVRQISDRFAADRRARQLRTSLVRAEFDELADAGFTRSGVPVDRGGLWSTLPASTRGICELLRTLAQGDSSVALVSAMHPSVLSFWLASPEAPEPYTKAWEQQREAVFSGVLAGDWWGTITSESGSGGDVLNTKAQARAASGTGATSGLGEADHRLTGAKQFGSGSGITSFMITTARPAGEPDPDWFVLPVKDVPWDGSTGMTLVGEWDGHGMIATQSHAMAFEDFPAVRFAWPGNLRGLIERASAFFGCCFTAVIVGVAETAVAHARAQLEPKQETLRAYERTEWAQVELEHWLIQQAYAGMLHAVETSDRAVAEVRRGKTAIAQLAEAALGRVCRVVGGGTFGRQSPFGCWFEDVRALGFLRPPWGLAYDAMYADSWAG